jgi:hypothetical protein
VPGAPDVFGGVEFPSTEPEVWLAANPADPNDLVGSIQQDRWSDGGAQGLVAPYSRDGGRTWKDVPLPFSVCASSAYGGNVLRDPFTGRPYDRASDPWVDIGPDGTAYAVSISFDANDNGGSVGAAVSTDGGRSWHDRQNIVAENADDPAPPFNDKQSMTADSVHAGTAYAVWDHLLDVGCPPGVPAGGSGYTDERDRGSNAAAAATVTTDQALDCFVGPAMISRTTNFGHTWSTPSQMVATPANEQTIGNEIVVDPRTGTVYDLYMYIHADNSLTIEDVASHDGGVTWGPRQVVSDSTDRRRRRPRLGRAAADGRHHPAAGDRSAHRALRRLAGLACERDRPERGRALHLDLDGGRRDRELEHVGRRQRARGRGSVHASDQGARQRRRRGAVLRPPEQAREAACARAC